MPRSSSRSASPSPARRERERERKRSSRSASRSVSHSRSRSRSPSARRSHREKQKKPKKKSAKAKKRRSRRSRSPSGSGSEADARAQRRQKRRAEKALAVFGYSDDANPFGDAQLSQPFVWGKKYEAAKGERRPSERALKQQQLARLAEIEKARQRREAREAEREEAERLRNEELRLRDAEQYDDWQQKEEQFHREQAKVRSKLRIAQRRERPVDVLAKNLLLVAQATGHDERDESLFRVSVERRRPHAIVEVLSMAELEELRESVGAYLELEGARGENREFWELMRLVCDDRIRRLRRSQSASTASAERGAIHSAVDDAVATMLHGKSDAELRALEREVAATVADAALGRGAAGVDVAFWEEVAQQIDVSLARARLAELHDAMLSKLSDLMDKAEDAAGDGAAGVGAEAGAGDESREAALLMEHTELEASEEKMGASEEVALAASAPPAWSDKYQPRKPRYFNRVKTGYDWNKYNQTHYDHDNPPPKVVQGYKFNLFFPDLIDKAAAPRFVLEPSSSPDFCIIRFSAGPPYEDIAFKIVNREWEYSHKRGFKSVFERGILHLYFNFKRHRYRR
ncbi:hypothetical protein PybrP1_006633 [[Pythium] brassicae (nom. inval.)]|nr:hypothetical protein PybrP1_006633 [[Pythium] brassicae (nom. inval.)]